MYALALAVVLFALSVAFLASALRRIGSWRATHRLRLSRCVLAILTCHLIAIPFWVIVPPILSDHEDDLAGPTVVYVAVWLFAGPWLYFLGDRALWFATKRWVVFALPVAATGLVFFHLIEDYVLQTDRSEVKALTPTIRARHTVEPCPKCGGEFVCELLSFPDPNGAGRRWIHGSGVCQDCFHTDLLPRAPGPNRDKDRYLINHLRAPERWRVVAFGSDWSTSSPTLGRLVGLPGETIFIRDGAVWVNNERQTPPAALGPRRYTEVVPQHMLDLDRKLKPRAKVRTKGFGHPDEPLTLAADEYFILDDDPESILDSRLSGPYRWKHYLGAVEFIFWPPARWGVVR